ncbi:MAG: ABC transporter permease [Anaerolineae bacterium]|nr:ABC transporter permease [Anaerolineae bacterium]
MNLRAIRAIALRDLKIVTRNKGVMLPLILLPLILMVIMPGAMGYFLPMAPPGEDFEDLALFLEMMPDEMAEQFAGYTETQVILVTMLVYFFAPMFLIVPLMVASTIAANSFAGEKERKTLEALIYTPTSDTELFMGKMLSAWLPAMGVALGGFVLYSVVVNLTAWPVMGEIFFPNVMWLILVLWVAPAAAGLGLGSMILVSSKANSFQDAYQIGAMVVLPVLLLIFGQIGGVIFLSPGFVFGVGLVLWLIDAAVLWFAIQTFQRNEIIARL